MNMNLNQVEKDFIEFLSKKRNRPCREMEDVFLRTRNRFKFSSLKYRELCLTVYSLNYILYDDVDEKDIIDSYKFHALMNLFRFISYTYPKSGSRYFDYLRALMSAVIKGEFGKLYVFLRRKILNKHESFRPNEDYASIARVLVEKISEPPMVVDYGCGLGHISFEIGKLESSSKVYLVDVDCLTLEFAEFRFQKHGINAEIIPVSKSELYPKLPMHNICIATEVMEHVMQPLVVYQNVYDSLEHGGILYGDFDDHHKEMFHVSPNLSKLRERIDADFKRVDNLCYKKRN